MYRTVIMLLMKDKILKLRDVGKSYKEIVAQLKCSKSLVAYYCNSTTKDKTIKKTNELRKKNALIQKVDNYKNRKNWTSKVRDFQRQEDGKPKTKATFVFTADELMKQFIQSPVCYLTGEQLDLTKSSTFSLDHKIPSSKGGDNSLENLGLCSWKVNQAKGDLSPQEFIELCKKVLIHNGYKVAEAKGVEPLTHGFTV